MQRVRLHGGDTRQDWDAQRKHAGPPQAGRWQGVKTDPNASCRDQEGTRKRGGSAVSGRALQRVVSDHLTHLDRPKVVVGALGRNDGRRRRVQGR